MQELQMVGWLVQPNRPDTMLLWSRCWEGPTEGKHLSALAGTVRILVGWRNITERSMEIHASTPYRILRDHAQPCRDPSPDDASHRQHR